MRCTEQNLDYLITGDWQSVRAPLVVWFPHKKGLSCINIHIRLWHRLVHMAILYSELHSTRLNEGRQGHMQHLSHYLSTTAADIILV